MTVKRNRIPSWDRSPKFFWTVITKGHPRHSMLYGIRKFISRIPQWTYPAGVKSYYQILWDKGETAWQIILWRSAWHWLGGVGLASLFSLALPPLMSIAVVACLAGIKETWENEGSWKKQLIDVAAWTAGGAMTLWL